MDIPQLVTRRLHAVLEEHAGALRDGLRRALVERTFPPHPRHRGKPVPAHDATDALRGIRVIYMFPDFAPLVCGLSRAGAWKCGARPLLEVRGDLFDSEIEDQLLAAVPAELRNPASEALVTLQTELVENWIRAAWLAVRAIAPELRGYLSEHDGGPIIDLDTGEQVEERALGLGYL